MTNKKLRNGIIAVTLVAVVGIGGTLAYFSSVTNTKENTFTMGSGITGEVDEPNYDPQEALKFTPGKVIVKDPLVKNTSTEADSSAYAGVKITCKDANGNVVPFATLDKFINVNFNETDWTFDAAKGLAYYNSQVAPNSQTTPVFSEVEIDPLALTPEMIASADTDNCQFDITKYEVKDENGVTTYTYKDYKMGNFKIEITGYLVQTEGFTTPIEALKAAFNTVFTDAAFH